jgi:hypothetical protein
MRYSEYFGYARALKDSDPVKCEETIRFTERKAGSASDLTQAARLWIDCFGDLDNARRCLLMAECRWWDSCRELIECAQSHIQLLHDHESAARCVLKASTLSSSEEDWCRCEEFFREQGYDDLANACAENSRGRISNPN